jgi:hypothetical protein
MWNHIDEQNSKDISLIKIIRLLNSHNSSLYANELGDFIKERHCKTLNFSDLIREKKDKVISYLDHLNHTLNKYEDVSSLIFVSTLMDDIEL